MANRTEICNMAISHLAIGQVISAWDTDQSVEAVALRAFYPTIRDQMLTSFEWPFARKIASLALLEEDPNDLWEYSYSYPADCVTMLRIVSGSRVDQFDSIVQYERMGSAIYTDEDDADIEYIYRVTNEALFPADFVMALSLRLALAIAPRVIAGDNQALLKRLQDQYIYEMLTAQANAANEAARYGDIESDYAKARL